MGYKIREVRESRGMTQEELSQVSGVSRVTISGLENGTTRATTTKTLVAIAHALKVPVDQIFFSEDVKPIKHGETEEALAQ